MERARPTAAIEKLAGADSTATHCAAAPSSLLAPPLPASPPSPRRADSLESLRTLGSTDTDGLPPPPATPADAAQQYAQPQPPPPEIQTEQHPAPLSPQRRTLASPRVPFQHLQHPLPTAVVRLNVGGRAFMTSTSTLDAQPDSLLCALVRHNRAMRGALLESDTDCVFVDRDGAHFEHVLNWLRACASGSRYVPPPRSARALVQAEAEYYGLPDLAQALEMCTYYDEPDTVSPLKLLQLRTMGATDLDGGNFSRGCYAGMRFPKSVRCADFRFADLSRACLAGVDLSGSDLTGCVLDGADLSHATLTGCALAGASLRGANLGDALLDGLCLTGVSDLTDACFAAAHMARVDLHGRQDLARANLERATLTGADLRGCNLQSANLKGASAQHARFSGACLLYASLQPSDSPRLNMGAQEQETDLQHAELDGANLLCATVQRADFRFARLVGVNLSGANTSHARFEHTVLAGARCAGAPHTRRISLT